MIPNKTLHRRNFIRSASAAAAVGMTSTTAVAAQRDEPVEIGIRLKPDLASPGGVVVPPEGYHQRFLEVCRQHGILYVAETVVPSGIAAVTATILSSRDASSISDWAKTLV